MSDALVQSATIQLKAQAGGGFGSVPDGGLSGISSVAGTVADGEVLTISGGGFGSGPANVMFENYSNGIEGSQVLASNTNFTIDTANAAKGLRDPDSRSGAFSNSVFQDSGVEWVPTKLGISLPDVTETFVSYAVKIPTGANFPGNDGGNSGTNSDYSTDSSWKQDWLLGDDPIPSVDDDLISLSHVGNGVWHTGGNDLGVLKNWGTDPSFWKWGKWNRVSKWVKGGAIPNVDAGNLYVQIANTETPIIEDSSTPVVFANGTAPYAWKQYDVPGWIRPRATQGGVKVLYDDAYIAWGDNSAARVELGNASTYEACTDLAICDPVTWADGEIPINCREGGLNLSAPTWLYVTLSDNVTRYSYQVVS